MLSIVLAMTLLTGLAACETTKGFIKDSENVGQAIVNGG